MMRHRGSSLVDWSARIFGDDAAERVFAPLVADWMHERRERPAGMRHALADLRWVAAIAYGSLVVGARLAVRWRVPAPHARAALRAMTASAVSGMGVLVVAPAILVSTRHTRELTLTLALALFAHAITVALPLALGPGAALLARASSAAPARRWMLSGITMSLLVVQFVSVGWVHPRLGQALSRERVCTIGATLAPRGIPLHDLLRPAATDDPEWPSSDARRSDLWNRLSWTIWPAAVAVFAWRLGARLPRRRQHVVVSVAWLVPAAALIAGALLPWWSVVGSPFEPPSAPVQFLPTLTLVALAVLLSRPVEADPSLS